MYNGNYSLTIGDGSGVTVDKGMLAVLLQNVACHYENGYERGTAATLMSKFMVSSTITVTRAELMAVAAWAAHLNAQLVKSHDRLTRIIDVANGLIKTADMTHA
jgi:hypothetical protein